MKPKIIKNNLGISLLEVVMAIMIIALGLLGVLSLVIQNVKAQYINKNVLIASGLAQEGLELVRNVRDLNWLTPGNSWKADIKGVGGDKTYTIDYQGRDSIKLAANLISDDAARLYINSGGFYTHTATATSTNFYRLITVVVNNDYLDIKCAIRWQEGAQNHDYAAETYLYDWR